MFTPYKGIDHLGVAVNDLQEAQSLYRDVLGFAISGGESLPERGLEVCFVETGNGRIELLAPTRDDSEVSKFLARRGEGLHHVCVEVDDIERTLAELRGRGAKLIDDVARSGAHGSRVAFVHPKGAAGVLLELVEHRKEVP